ncbi:MAG: TetR/AcrR family transcriptional regulator, partial [Streptomycetaceae bacterium]|nr:TetR/AcrR family transcriptional regulator [Streptomycetaceae bacterium]
ATRAAIMDSALRVFSRDGFEKASVRRIATEAGCDPMLVLRYYGTKDELFRAASSACMEHIDREDLRPDCAERAGEHLVRACLRFWSHPEAHLPVLCLLRSAATHPSAGERMVDMLAADFVRPVAESLGVGDVALRSTLIATQLLGLAMALHITPMAALRDADPDHVVALIAPTVQRYLTDPLPVGTSV